MPELPEVETIRRQLARELPGLRIDGVEVLDSRFVDPGTPAAFVAACEGREVRAVGRRGKYLLLELEGEVTLMMHLRMTGNLLLGGTDDRHLRARFRLSDGRELRFVDPRRLGHGRVFASAATLAEHLDARLGPEPLSDQFTPQVLGDAATGRRTPLKSFLLDQAAVAGIGNIYADEALHRARLHPLSPADSMRPQHHSELFAGIRESLDEGLRHGGASIDDYRQVDGGVGGMQNEFLVHRREGEECPRCGAVIRRIVVGGRSTYFCAACQTRLRRRRTRR